MKTKAHQYMEGQARANGTRFARHEVCQHCGLVHSWGGDEATGEVRHSYRAGTEYDERGMLPDETSSEPPCSLE